MPEHEPITCSCRDRETRLLRAIIDAASRTDDAKSALPNPDTALPLPKVGNGGNTVERLVHLLVKEGVLPGDLLMAAWQTLPAAPMASQRESELRAFVRDVRERAGLLSFSRELARQVHDAVTMQRELERRLDDDIRRMRDREKDQRAKNEGTYWRERDGRRTARQPAHVLVKPAAWEAMKREAQLRRTTVGELVGQWIRDLTSDPSQTEDGKVSGKGLGTLTRLPMRDGKVSGGLTRLPNPRGNVTLDHLVVRLAISSHDWASAKVHASILGVTIARYVGLAVERNVRKPRRR
jgi:hypothetical protein